MFLFSLQQICTIPSIICTIRTKSYICEINFRHEHVINGRPCTRALRRVVHGGLAGTRTQDRLLKRQLLYQLSYEPYTIRVPLRYRGKPQPTEQRMFLLSCLLYGLPCTRGFSRVVHGTPRGIRTPNLLVRSQTLYPVELWVLTILWTSSKASRSK